MVKEIVSMELGGKELSFETGFIAKQAAGSTIVRLGDTVVIVAATHANLRAGLDFFPLMVDYRERGYAAGMIFGGRFNKREGKPSDREVLVSRMTDRPIRPLWPKGFKRDVLIQAISLSAAPDVDPDTLVINGASMALCLSDLPFKGPIGACRVGYVGGELAVNPTPEQIKASDLDLLVAGTESAITMVEAGAKLISEEAMTEALLFAHEQIKKICALQNKLAAVAGKPKMAYEEPVAHPIQQTLFEKHFDECAQVAAVPDKMERAASLSELKKKLIEMYAASEADGADSGKPTASEVSEAFSELKAAVIRKAIKDNKRVDGRDRDTVRPIECLVGWLPRTHGSAIFTRGETQAIVTTTLGTVRDEQLHETLLGEYSEPFLLHYNFPSFSVGETKPPRAPNRREIGHGTLARRALLPLMPSSDDFPYTIRIVSEITESNGSSSMATVCGGTLSLLDAGVPLKAPVAGVAMGLVADDDGEFIITDILGDEDHYGDMDFKVTGTKDGITALQMDIKMSGLGADTLRNALEKARHARLHVLNEMAKTITEPREQISQYAPKIISVTIPKDMIGKIIGPGGSMVRKLEEEYNVKVDIEEEDDKGIVIISSSKRDDADKCAAVVEGMTAKPQVGKIYSGTVVSVRDFGVFVEVLPGVDGMCHVSELEYGYIKNPADVVAVGDKIEVKLIDIDDLGRLRLSRKVLLPKPEGMQDKDDHRGDGDSHGKRRHRKPRNKDKE